jgi:hypothetical protein
MTYEKTQIKKLFCLLVTRFTYSLTLKMEAVQSSKRSVNSYQTVLFWARSLDWYWKTPRREDGAGRRGRGNGEGGRPLSSMSLMFEVPTSTVTIAHTVLEDILGGARRGLLRSSSLSQ